MSLDRTLLRLFATRERYEKYARAVPAAALGEVTSTLIRDYGRFYNQFPDVQRIEAEPFTTWFFTFGHPNMASEAKERFRPAIQDITKPVPPELEAGFMARLVDASTASQAADLLERYNEGDEVNLGAGLRDLVDRFEQELDKKVQTPWVRDHIKDLLSDDQNDRGFKFRLAGINLCLRAMIPGDFGIIAARPDVGKSTFLTDNLTYFAPQVDEIFPGEDRNILWFNNEGPGRRMKKRLYQSALNATYSDLLDLQDKGVLVDRYAEALGGDEDRIRIFDVHDFWNYEIEDQIRQHNPAMIVFDMIDNIKFGGATNNNGQRTDQLLEAMYQWARVIGVKHDCVVLATSQISADGEGMTYPTLSMLKDSKTGKQGAADFILTIGAQSGAEGTRWLGTTKNKLAREGGSKTLKLPVQFDGARGRYNEPDWTDPPSETATEDPTTEDENNGE